jgi:hypothetical protein
MPIPIQALAAVSELPREGGYVFSGFYGRKWSQAGAEKSWGHFREALGLQDVVLHDFRRGIASRLYERERDPFLLKAVLNHYVAVRSPCTSGCNKTGLPRLQGLVDATRALQHEARVQPVLPSLPHLHQRVLSPLRLPNPSSVHRQPSVEWPG